MIIKLQGSIVYACYSWNPASLHVSFEVNCIITDLYPLGHHNNALFIPKQHAHKENDLPGAVSSLPIDIII